MKTLTCLLFWLVMHGGASYAQIPEIKWWYDVNDMAFGNACIADVDNDGKPEIIFSCYRNDSSIYVLNAEDGTLLWKRNTGGCNDVAPVVFDFNGDGNLDIVLPSSCVPKTFCFDGATGDIKWEVFTHGSDSPPSIGDLDGDGEYEVLHGEFLGYVICIDGNTGAKKWQFQVSDSCWIQTAPALADLDGDGLPDFVVATWHFGNKHRIYAYRGYDQELLWESDLPQDVMYHGASVADIDNDGKPELVIGSYDGAVYILNGEDGSLYAQFSFPSSYYVGAPTSIADLNNDGFYEIVFFDWFKVGVLSHTGDLLWDYSIPSYGSAFRGAAISDIDGNGIPDVVFGTTTGQLIALKGDDGSLVWNVNLQEHFGANVFKIDHGPVIADFDGDGFPDVFVVGGHAEYPAIHNNYGRGYAVSTNSAGGPDWPMFRRDIRRNACVPIDSIPTHIHGIPAAKTLSCYPNPAKEVVNIHSTEVFGSGVLQVTDVQGRIMLSVEPVHSFTCNRIELDVSCLRPGVYYVTWKEGSVQGFCKMVVAR